MLPAAQSAHNETKPSENCHGPNAEVRVGTSTNMTTFRHGVTTFRHGVTKIRRKVSAGTPTSSSASASHSDDTAETPRNPARQNARPILALAGFKSVISVIKYQEFTPDPSDASAMASRGMGVF